MHLKIKAAAGLLGLAAIGAAQAASPSYEKGYQFGQAIAQLSAPLPTIERTVAHCQARGWLTPEAATAATEAWKARNSRFLDLLPGLLEEARQDYVDAGAEREWNELLAGNAAQLESASAVLINELAKRPEPEQAFMCERLATGFATGLFDLGQDNDEGDAFLRERLRTHGQASALPVP